MLQLGEMIYLGSDHRGFGLKEQVKQWLIDQGFEVADLGNDHFDPNDDYPIFAEKVANAVSGDSQNRGILFCGSGVGVDIVANKIKGIRSALVFDTKRVIQSRQHEDINVLSLPADLLELDKTYQMVQAFLQTPFSSQSRHLRRLEELKSLEEKND